MTILKPTTVYLVGLEDGDYVFPFTKIGVALSMKSRLGSLNTGTPFNCFAYREYLFQHRSDALRAEKSALALLNDRKAKGEWVHGRPDEIAPIVRHLLIDKSPREKSIWERLDRTPKVSLWDPINKCLKGTPESRGALH
ncbi:GIY-YIG nuclease family protein [Bosea sp. LjRoot237]|uniref:GIY-YIG nuclease family protein n=1 Tax=Bosea sp. LjRoot237 TaxID=3342292 RepID=UPI003ECC28D8